jgi:hypothetical protein
MKNRLAVSQSLLERWQMPLISGADKKNSDARNFHVPLRLDAKARRKDQTGECNTENPFVYHSRLTPSASRLTPI